jgi:hypothetical protein
MTDSAAAPPTQTTDHDHACENLPPIPLSASIANLITYISLPVTIIFSIVWWYKGGMGARDEKTALGGDEKLGGWTGDEKTRLLVDVE